jgi:two-component system NtrC family sensor kinase
LEGGVVLRLGTKLTLYLSLIIILVLSAYGYVDILTRRAILIEKMKAGVRNTGRTLETLLGTISLPEGGRRIRGLADAMDEYERTLGIIVYYEDKTLIIHSPSLGEGIEPYLDLIKRSIREDRPQEAFGTYKKTPIFSYAFPFKDRTGRNIGGISILHETSFMEKEIVKAKWRIYITIFVLIGGTVALVLLGTRQWVTKPISKLMEGVENLAKGNLDHRIDLKGRNELSELARAFNHMAVDLKEAQQRILREAQTKLELERHLRQSDKLATIGQLASGLAHEIGTPLNIIYGRAELIQRRLEDKEGIKKNLDIIIGQTERITKILRQLLGFVRKKEPERKPLKINTLIETTLDLLDHQIQKQKIRVEATLSENLPQVIGDPDQLQQAFLNLLLNAIQAMPEGGTLRLSAFSKTISKEGLEEAQRQYMEVVVEDTGVGIEREAIQNIFNPFFTTKDSGTGLGLMVTQGIIQDHEGWIDVESEIRKGSVFKIYLPSFQGGDR